MADPPVLENGMILIQGSKIKKIGRSFDIPAGAVIYDNSGKTVIPGLVCALSSFGLHKEDIRESGDENPDADILDGMNFLDESFSESISYGLTTIHISPVSFKFKGGLGAVVKAVPNPGSIPPVLKKKASLHFHLDVFEGQKSSNLLRLRQYYKIRDLFQNAQQYQEKWEEYQSELKKYETEKKQKSSSQKRKEPKKPRRDSGKEILLEAMQKKIPVWITVHRPDAIGHALRLQEEFGFDLVLERCEDWHPMLPILEKKNVSILSNPLLNYHKFLVPGGENGFYASQLILSRKSFYKDEYQERSGEKDISISWTALTKAGIPLGLSPPEISPDSSKYLRLYASLLVAEGMSVQEALASITCDPAKIMRVFDRVGSLEEGKDADLVVLNGEPLNTLSQVDMVFIDGTLVWQKQ
jgi:hypothetical protein